MGISTGYGRAITSGSVFAFDTADVINSYKGEPTTNYHDYDKSVMNQTGFNNWSCYDGSPPYHTWGTNQSRTFVTIPGPDGKDTPAMLYYNFNGGFYGPTDWGGIPAAICTTGNKITIQAWVKAADTASVGLVVSPYTYFSLNSGGAEATATNWNLTANWQLVSNTHTLSSAATNTSNILYFFTTNGSSPVRMYLTKTAILSGKDHAVQWLPGGTTRSATQGLLPLAGNSSIDLSNMSFDSNAQLTFDGTNDFIDTDFPAMTINNPTMEAVVYRDTNTGRYEAIIQNNVASDDALYVFPGGFLGFWPCAASSLTVPVGQWNYVAVSYDGSNLTFCVNGTTQVIANSCADITDWDFLRIGAHGAGDGERWIGKIAVAKVYDRALSIAELKQNYNKYKTRFKLS